MRTLKKIITIALNCLLLTSSFGYSGVNSDEQKNNENNEPTGNGLVCRLNELSPYLESENSENFEELEAPKIKKKSSLKKRASKFIKKFHAKPKADEPETDELMENFYLEVEAIVNNCALIKEATGQITGLEDDIKLMTDPKKEVKILSKIEKIRSQTNQLLKTTKGKLDKMKLDNEDYKNCSPRPQNLEGNIRIRENVFRPLINKFKNESQEYRLAQVNFKSTIEKKAKRQIQSIAPEINEEVLENIENNPEIREQIFANFISQGEVNPQIRLAYEKASEKYNAVKKLEQDVAMLHQLFLDLAVLVDIQGEQLDNIEYNLKLAAEDIEAGNVAIYEAVKSAKKIRNRRLVITVLTAAAVTVTVVILV